jgi:hypothetical protein
MQMHVGTALPTQETTGSSSQPSAVPIAPAQELQTFDQISRYVCAHAWLHIRTMHKALSFHPLYVQPAPHLLLTLLYVRIDVTPKESADTCGCVSIHSCHAHRPHMKILMRRHEGKFTHALSLIMQGCLTQSLYPPFPSTNSRKTVQMG